MRKVTWRNYPWLPSQDAFGCRPLLWRWIQSKFSCCYELIGLCFTDTIFCFVSSFTYPQIILVWGNFVAFYVINLILSVVPSLQMHNVMLRLCNQPSYWITMAVSLMLFPILIFITLTMDWPFYMSTTLWNHLFPADCNRGNGSSACSQILEKSVPA
jgi:hypothetical protein